ncbi:MAG TPA: PKD domain-containing protein [Methanospirillum sp.]|nr:PKD domain-containing protein [Methanospirillum sp.]
MGKYHIILFLLVAGVLCIVPAAMGEEQSGSGNDAFPDSCGPQAGGACVIADFIASPTIGDAPLRVQFLDTSAGKPSMWSWDFGDGGTATAVADPVHIYTTPGIYTVRMTASSLNGGSSTKVKEAFITVLDPTPISADFVGHPTSGKAPLSVQFSDCTIGNTTWWDWDFGDGGTSHEQYPVHIYRTPGKYTVSLAAGSNIGGSSTKVKPDYITVEGSCIIAADFTSTPSSGSAPLTVQFTDLSTGGPTMWSWDFGDGSTDMVASPIHTYTKPGTYTVRMSASSQTCISGSQQKVITVSAPPMVVDFSGTPRSGYAPLTVQFTDLSTGNPTMWSWDFGDGVIPMETCSGGGCGNIANPTHTYTEPGTYTVRLTASNQNGSSGTKVREAYITVQEKPCIVADFSGTPRSGNAPLTVQFTDLSTGNPTMWLWDFGDGAIPMETCSGGGCGNIANPTHTYTRPGTYTVRLTASSESAGSSTKVKEAYITVQEKPCIVADFSGTPTSGKAPLTVQFTDLSTGNPTMWSWDFGDGAIPMVTCSGGSCGNIANPSHTYLNPGTYTVRLTASSEIAGASTKVKEGYITVISEPVIDADFTGTPTSGQVPLTVQFTDRSTGGPTMWSWDFGDGVIPMETCSGGGCNNIANPVHTYTEPGLYTVSLTASNQNGATDTETKANYISVSDIPSGDAIPISSGWNFVSVPRTLAPSCDTASIFSHIDGGGHSMFVYDTTMHVWDTLNSASPIKPLDAFWIYSTKTDVVPLVFDTNPGPTPRKELKKGWNSVGFTGQKPLEARVTFDSVKTNWVNCAGFNAAAQKYNAMIIKGSNDDTKLNPYLGYWLYMSAGGTLIGNTL